MDQTQSFDLQKQSVVKDQSSLQKNFMSLTQEYPAKQQMTEFGSQLQIVQSSEEQTNKSSGRQYIDDGSSASSKATS